MGPSTVLDKDAECSIGLVDTVQFNEGKLKKKFFIVISLTKKYTNVVDITLHIILIPVCV
jgi:hypothetical protein